MQNHNPSGMAVKDKKARTVDYDTKEHRIENAILSAVFAGYIDEFAAVSPDMFRSERCGSVFSTCRKLHESGQTLSIVSVSDYIERCGELSEHLGPGWANWLLELCDGRPITEPAWLTQQVIESHCRRRIKSTCEQVCHHADDPTFAVAELATKLKSLVDDSVTGSRIPHLSIRKLSDVTPQRVEWLWLNRFAMGKFNLLGGDPGLGKSHFTIDLAARVTTGNVFPDRSGRAPLGSVVILSAEDDAEDTIRPRLDRAGADCSRVLEIQATRTIGLKDGKLQERVFNLEDDLPLLEMALKKQEDVRLIIIDPISSYLGKTDSHKNAEVRGLIAPLADLASRFKVCILGVTHLNKGAGNKSSYRMTGSLAFAAAARTVWLWAEDTEQPGRLLLLPGKNNLAERQSALACKIMSDSGGSFLAWEADPVALTADGYLEKESRKGGETGDETQMDAAVQFLKTELADGPQLVTEVEDSAKQVGISKRTLDRARKTLQIKPFKRSADRKWAIELPTL